LGKFFPIYIIFAFFVLCAVVFLSPLHYFSYLTCKFNIYISLNFIFQYRRFQQEENGSKRTENEHFFGKHLIDFVLSYALK
jgi:hypothetical protein